MSSSLNKSQHRFILQATDVLIEMAGLGAGREPPIGTFPRVRGPTLVVLAPYSVNCLPVTLLFLSRKYQVCLGNCHALSNVFYCGAMHTAVPSVPDIILVVAKSLNPCFQASQRL